MWAPILEKAWAKIKGSYDAADGGFITSGIRALTGAPVFRYEASEINVLDEDNKYILMSAYDAYMMLKSAEDANFMMGVSTDGNGNDQEKNSCGIAKSHAYSILSVFSMTDAEGVEHTMLLMRNPWGKTTYSSDWKSTDSRWTDELVA